MSTKKNTGQKRPSTIPAGVTTPTDHQKPDAPLAEVSREGRQGTVQDITFRLSPGAADDFELLDDLYRLDRDKNGLQLPSILRRLVGDEEYRRVLGELADPVTGRVGMERGIGFVMDVVRTLNPSS